MKKPTLSRPALASHLREIAVEVQRLAAFDLEDEDFREWFHVDTLHEEFFSTGEAAPAPERGRGSRITLPLGWIWPPARMSPEEGADLVRSLVGRVPGVEEVTAPALDPQFALVWQMYITIRLAQ
jgi:hypothetical protein